MNPFNDLYSSLTSPYGSAKLRADHNATQPQKPYSSAYFMTFVEELVQLLIIIFALLLVLFGVSFWTKKGGSFTLPSIGGSGASGGAGQHMTGIDGEDADGVPGTGSVHGSGGSGGKRKGGGSAAERHGDRFDLTGKDAEAAARVLKRMLKQDDKFKNQSEQ